MDCKSRYIDVLLAHCKGKYQLRVKILMMVYILSLPSQCSCVCFIVGSLIKAMQYRGNLDSENPVFFESISSAIDAMQIHRVRLTSKSR